MFSASIYIEGCFFKNCSVFQKKFFIFCRNVFTSRATRRLPDLGSLWGCKFVSCKPWLPLRGSCLGVAVTDGRDVMQRSWLEHHSPILARHFLPRGQQDSTTQPLYGTASEFRACPASKNRRAGYSSPADSSVNLTISFGVQPIMWHSFSSVTTVMFLFFLIESSVLLSIPLLIS